MQYVDVFLIAQASESTLSRRNLLDFNPVALCPADSGLYGGHMGSFFRFNHIQLYNTLTNTQINFPDDTFTFLEEVCWRDVFLIRHCTQNMNISRKIALTHMGHILSIVIKQSIISAIDSCSDSKHIYVRDEYKMTCCLILAEIFKKNDIEWLSWPQRASV